MAIERLLHIPYERTAGPKDIYALKREVFSLQQTNCQLLGQAFYLVEHGIEIPREYAFSMELFKGFGGFTPIPISETTNLPAYGQPSDAILAQRIRSVETGELIIPRSLTTEKGMKELHIAIYLGNNKSPLMSNGLSSFQTQDSKDEFIFHACQFEGNRSDVWRSENFLQYYKPVLGRRIVS